MKKGISIILCLLIVMSLVVSSFAVSVVAVKSMIMDDNKVTVPVGKTFALSVTFAPENASNKKVIFSSANKSIATVSATGVVKGIKAGKTVITATSLSNKKVMAKCDVTVVKVGPKVNLKIINFRVEDQEYYDNVNKEFMAYYSNIKVKYDAIATAEYPTLRSARIAAGEVDVIGSQPVDVRDLGIRSNYMDLSKLPFMAKFSKSTVDAGKYKGQALVMPLNTVSFVTFYNKDMFAKYGIAVPKTWKNFISACETLKSKGIDPILFAGMDQWPINMVTGQFEASIIRTALPDFWTKVLTEENKYTDAPWIEMFGKMKTLGKYFQKDSAGFSYGQAPGQFAQGKAAMMIDGSWSGAQITAAKPKFKVGAFILPASDNAKNNIYAPTKVGGGFSIYKGTKNLDAASKYLEFLSSNKQYTKYIEFVKMAPSQNNIKLSDPLSQEIANLNSNTITEWEQLFVPGGKYEFTNYILELIYGGAEPKDIADKFQKDLMGSKQTWVIDQ